MKTATTETEGCGKAAKNTETTTTRRKQNSTSHSTEWQTQWVKCDIFHFYFRITQLRIHWCHRFIDVAAYETHFIINTHAHAHAIKHVYTRCVPPAVKVQSTRIWTLITQKTDTIVHSHSTSPSSSSSSASSYFSSHAHKLRFYFMFGSLEIATYSLFLSIFDALVRECICASLVICYFVNECIYLRIIQQCNCSSVKF